MGVVYSMTDIMSSALTTEVKTETIVDGKSVIETKTRNPYVTSLVVIGATVVILISLDGGSGTLTQIFGRFGNKQIQQK